MKKRYIAGVLGAGAIALGIFAYNRSQASGPEGEIVTVSKGRIEVSVQEVGSIEPFRKVEIKSKVAGQVQAVLVDIGDEVQEGALLMKLDPQDAAREVKLSEARTKITESQLSVSDSQLALKKRAHANGALTEMELSLADGEVKRLNAQTSLEQVELQGARDRLAYTQIRSPIRGIVLARNVQPGEMVTPGVASVATGNPLLVVAQIEKLLVRTELNQIDVARIKPKGKVDIGVDALPGKRFVGEIFRIAAMAQKSERRRDSNLQIFPVDIVVDRTQASADMLRAGMMADINIGLEAKDDVLLVPLEALVREGSKTKLWRVQQTTEKKEADELVEVSIGLQNDRQVEIMSGVKEGDRIRIKPASAEKNVAKS
jgi:macrolide-specific efflux system membrane fusion protein